MPYPNEHACRIRQPLDGAEMARANGSREHEGRKYDVIYQRNADGSMEDQAFRYPTEKWTAAQAQAHCEAHDGITFEAATDGKETMPAETKPDEKPEPAKARITVDRNAPRWIYLPKGKLAAKALEANGDNGPGYIEGYASVFGNVDEQAEIVKPGAFSKTIGERVPAGKVKLMRRHLAQGGGTDDVIGTITSAKQDEYGLWYHADLSATPEAQSVRQKVLEGHVTGNSIGYFPVTWHFERTPAGKEVLALDEVKLLEVTVTPFPVNELAQVNMAKSIAMVAEGFDRILSRAGGKSDAISMLRGLCQDEQEMSALIGTIQKIGSVSKALDTMLRADAAGGVDDSIIAITKIGAALRKRQSEMLAL